MKVIVGGIIEKDGKYLLIKEAKKMCYGKWNFPAGHLDFNESLEQGAIREIKEETGCDVKLDGVCYVANRILEDDLFVMIVFNAKLINENIEFDKEEILDVKWISKEELENMGCEDLRDEKLIKRTLEMLRKNKIYPLDIIEIL